MNYRDKMSDETKKEFDGCISRMAALDDVEAIYLFGSYACGVPHEDSDFDLYVIVKNTCKKEIRVAEKLYSVVNDSGLRFDILVSNIRNFDARSKTGRATLDKMVREKGVLLHGDTGLFGVA